MVQDVAAILCETQGKDVDVMLDIIGEDTLSRSPDALARFQFVDIAQPQNLFQAWGKNAIAEAGKDTPEDL